MIREVSNKQFTNNRETIYRKNVPTSLLCYPLSVTCCMKIGIDGSRAFLPERTGIEEYSYQVIKHLRDSLHGNTVYLYIRFGQKVDFDLPEHWRVRELWLPRFWTQIRLSLELFFHPVDVLFIPAHTVPFLHPQKTIVTIHGLEYEFCPGAYSLLDRWYMRLSIRYSCFSADRIIAVSENTKKDLMTLYHVPERNIQVIHEGYEQYAQSPIPNSHSISNENIAQLRNEGEYILFIGRLEERKNVTRIIEAFGILKEKYQIPHRLILAGKPGYGYDHITYPDRVVELGYVSEEEKWKLLRGANVFVFPSLYEGFGIPVLEAQSVGVPVVTANTSSLPEVGGDGAVYVDPLNVESIAEGIWKVLSNEIFRDDIIEKGSRNRERFSWAQCAKKIGDLLGTVYISKRND